MKDLVSVIVPIYNTGLYLDECLLSIENQNFSNLEIILVDDGSTDDSEWICRIHASRDKRIFYYKKNNGGLSSARNFGLAKAKGDFICFVDSDDFVSRFFVEHFLENFRDDVDIVISGIARVSEDGCFDERSTFSLRNETFEAKKLLSKSISANGYQYVCAVNKMYRKTVFEGLSFEEGRIHEDEFFLNRLLESPFVVKTIPFIDYFYRKTVGSICNSPLSIKRIDACEAYLERSKIARKLKMKQEMHACVYLAASVLLQVLIGTDFSGNASIILRYLLRCYRPIIIRSCTYKIPYHLFRSFFRIQRLNIRFGRFIGKIHKCRKKFGRCVLMLATPVHGNLGDQAIVVSEQEFLKKCGIDKRQIIEVDNELVLARMANIQKTVNNNDLLILDGGGNIGTLWPNEDNKIISIINSFKNNRIIVFPQTCFYESGCHYRILRTKRALTSHEDLHIFLRDEKSFSLFVKLYPGVNCSLTPDIVLSLKPNISQKKKKRILICKRADKESSLDSDPSLQLKTEFAGFSVLTFSTVLNKRVTALSRKRHLRYLFRKISTAELVITDRLHALLFSFICSTKCICFDNKSNKVFGALHWVGSESVYKCENLAQLPVIVNKALRDPPLNGVSRSAFDSDFSCIASVIYDWKNR